VHILILKFRAEKYQQLVDDLESLADWMNSVEGLISKTWLQHSDSQQIGGIYHFDTQENLLAYKDSSSIAEFKQEYNITDWQESCFKTLEVDQASRKNRSPYLSD
jgi:Putative mono-oxygenase ydhR